MLRSRTLRGQARLVFGPTMYPGWLPACRGCGGIVIKPRRSFCSDACGEAVSIANDPAYARRRVAARDSGICAICKLDCGELDNVFDLEKKRERIIALGRVPPKHLRVTLWEMDHVIPVAEGGGACGLDNLRTLCVWCHKDETRALFKRLPPRKWSEEQYQARERSRLARARAYLATRPLPELPR